VKRTILLSLFLAACGGDDSSTTGNHPDPAVIAGGGFGSGAIDGVVNFYAIDDVTREPVAGASVRIGEIEGTTGADGLFVAESTAEVELVGPQQVVVTADGYRSELWTGANGANMTANLHPLNRTIPQATLSGGINGLGSITVPTGHFKLAAVTYSQVDQIGEDENNLKTPMDANGCVVTATSSGPCTFEVVTRTGKVGLIALIFDFDTKGTVDKTDDTLTLVGYAQRTGIDVTDGVDQSGQDLEVIPMNQLATETVAFGTPPTGLHPALGIVGIELGDGSGVFQLPIANRTTTSGPVPALSVFPGAQYRLSAIAQNDATPPTQSVVLRRHLTSTTLDAGTWSAPPTNVSLTRTHASWTPSADGTVHGVEYLSGTTSVLNISSFDGTSEIDIPEVITLAAGTLTGKVTALTAPSIDLSDIALDRDRDKITAAASTPAQIN